MPDEAHKPTRPRPTEPMTEVAGDPGRLLHGEDPGTEFADDARHWIAVYKELLGFKHDMLANLRERTGTLSEEARGEVLDTDIPVMEAEAERFRIRIAFWERRRDELSGGNGSSGHD
jgi:hypothetical protein